MASSIFAVDEPTSELNENTLPFIESENDGAASEFSEEELPYVEEESSESQQALPFSEDKLPFIEESENNIVPLEDTTQDLENHSIYDTDKIQTDISKTSNFTTMLIFYFLAFLLIFGTIIYFLKIKNKN
jgi:hypothetical protein